MNNWELSYQKRTILKYFVEGKVKENFKKGYFSNILVLTSLSYIIDITKETLIFETFFHFFPNKNFHFNLYLIWIPFKLLDTLSGFHCSFFIVTSEAFLPAVKYKNYFFKYREKYIVSSKFFLAIFWTSTSTGIYLLTKNKINNFPLSNQVWRGEDDVSLYLKAASALNRAVFWRRSSILFTHFIKNCWPWTVSTEIRLDFYSLCAAVFWNRDILGMIKAVVLCAAAAAA